MSYMGATAKSEVEREYGQAASQPQKTVPEKAESRTLRRRKMRFRVRYAGRYVTLRTVLLAVLAVLAAFTAVVYLTFDVRRAYVIGSDEFYSKNEIVNLITEDHGSLGTNSLFLTLLYHGQTSDIPFISSIKITMVSPTSINVSVTEKDIVGRIAVNGKWVYISSTGVAQEYTDAAASSIPVISGVQFYSATLGEKVVTKNPAGYTHVLDALRMLHTYDVSADSLAVTDKGVSLTFGKVKVQIGTSGYDLKVQKIKQLLPYLDGRQGTIDLTNYTEEDENIILETEGN